MDQIRIITAAPGSATITAAATDTTLDDRAVPPADAIRLPLDDAGAAVAPIDNNVDTTTGQVTNQIYLPLVSR